MRRIGACIEIDHGLKGGGVRRRTGPGPAIHELDTVLDDAQRGIQRVHRSRRVPCTAHDIAKCGHSVLIRTGDAVVTDTFRADHQEARTRPVRQVARVHL